MQRKTANQFCQGGNKMNRLPETGFLRISNTFLLSDLQPSSFLFCLTVQLSDVFLCWPCFCFLLFFFLFLVALEITDTNQIIYSSCFLIPFRFLFFFCFSLSTQHRSWERWTEEREIKRERQKGGEEDRIKAKVMNGNSNGDAKDKRKNGTKNGKREEKT